MYFSLYFRNQQANQGDNSPTLMLEVLGNGHSNGKSSCETRRATEDRLAVIFLVIILAFIFCHLPRVSNILLHNTKELYLMYYIYILSPASGM